MNPPAPLPPKLQSIVALFESLPDEEKRETLISYAQQAHLQAPSPNEPFDIEDIRKDEECTDTVGIHLRISPDGLTHWRISLGPNVQTLTRALATILCKGLANAHYQQVLDLPHDFIPRIVGAHLVRARSQTVYYLLGRIKSLLRSYLQRQQLSQPQPH